MLQRRRRKRPRPSLDHRRVQPATSATGEGRVHELSAATEEEELKRELSATQPKGRKEETTTETSSTDEDDQKRARCGELDTTEAKEKELSGRGTRQGIEVELGGVQLGNTAARKGSRPSGARHGRRWSSAAAHGSRWRCRGQGKEKENDRAFVARGEGGSLAVVSSTGEEKRRRRREQLGRELSRSRGRRKGRGEEKKKNEREEMAVAFKWLRAKWSFCQMVKISHQL